MRGAPRRGYNGRMRSRKALRLFLPALLAGGGLAGCGPGDANKPNLLVVTVDTLRKDAIGCCGAPEARTPSFDRLAEGGILLANASSQVPITLPSHATLFTGLYPAAHGTRHNGTPLREEETTLAERLSERGYETAAFLGSQVLSSSFRLGQGFDVYDDRWKKAERGLHGLWERGADSVAASFLSWFDHRDKKKPFFAWVHFYDPHADYEPPAPFGPAAGGDYAGEVAYADRALGRVLAAIEEGGLLDETIVVLLSDHGEGLGEHEEREHGLLLYETTLAIPWAIRLPGGPRGVLVTAPALTVDLLPTLADLLPIDKDPSWPGRSLVPLLRGAAPGPDRPLFAESLYGNVGYGWAPLYAVRLGPWKLVRGNWDDLYDVDQDPAENVNLAAEHPEVARRLGEAIDAWKAEGESPAGPAPELTREERAMLEGLGYAAPSSPPPAGALLPDPRERFLAHEKIIESRVLAEEGRRDLARDALLEALRIDPNNLDALLRVAPYYRELGEFEREREIYLTILSIDPDHAPAWNNLGVLKEIDGDFAGALACYDRSLQSDSTFADAYVNRGNVYVTQGKLGQAMGAYEKALRLDPGSGEAHYGKAMVHDKRGEFEPLVEELKLALRVDPNLVPAREWLQALERSAQTGI